VAMEAFFVLSLGADSKRVPAGLLRISSSAQRGHIAGSRGRIGAPVVVHELAFLNCNFYELTT